MIGVKSCACFDVCFARAFAEDLSPFLATLSIAQRYPPNRVPVAFAAANAAFVRADIAAASCSALQP